MSLDGRPSFEEVYARWQAPLLAFVSGKVRDRAEAEDLAGKAWLKAYEHWASFDGRNAGGWVYRIAQNVVYDKFRHDAVLRMESWEAGTFAAPADLLTPERAALGREDDAEARAMTGLAFELLPRRSRHALWLHAYARLTYRQIADLEGSSEHAVKSLLYRAQRVVDEAVLRERRRSQAQSIRARLARFTDRRGPDECWPWLGQHGTQGYPVLWLRPPNRRRRLSTAQRVVLAVTHGPLPPRAIAKHVNGNPACVNPAHLYAAWRVQTGRVGVPSTFVPVAPHEWRGSLPPARLRAGRAPRARATTEER
ncbi:MAG TPA: sigma-70 family RNA polymerase sigma factor [Rhodothermales bacterium]|nr:sigma-70 family RNA polymerase sigma factor [Rhodothermales bacterium]